MYAILGLLQDELVLPLQADYSSSTTDGWVFLQAAAWHISTTKSLEILSQVDGISTITMPSWVPDWTRKSPASLPAQFEVSKEPSMPRFTSLDGQPLSSAVTLDYPLECVLQVTGRRCGTVWTDRRIFGQTPVPSKSASKANAGNKRSPYATHPYSRKGGGHWLHNPSRNPRTRSCNKRLDFWGRILLLYSSTIPSGDLKADYITSQADIPPSFGGLCRKCFEIDDMYFQTSQEARRRRPCYCALKSSPEHFDNNELEEFLAKMIQHGTNRKIFGTDHSIGFGPMELEDWDEVWILEGARVPFILRRIDNHYKLVGACYVQAASRTADRCSNCSDKTDRKEITLRPKLRARPAAEPLLVGFGPWADRTRSTPSGLASSELSHLFAMEEYPFGFEEPLTGTLPGRPELRARPAADPAARIGFEPWADRTRSTPLGLASSESSRLFAMEEYPFGFEEPLTGILPGRPEPRAKPAADPAARIGFGPWVDWIRSTLLGLASSISSYLFAMEEYPSGFEEPLTGTLLGQLEEIKIQ